MKSKLHSTTRPSKFVLTLAVISTLVIATSATVWSLAVTTKNSHNRGVVMYVGDSNIMLGSGQTTMNNTWGAHNDNSYTPMFVTRVGAGIRTPDCLNAVGCTTTDFWTTKLAETFPKVDPDVVVVNLGVNDTVSPGTETTLGYSKYGKKIDWFMNSIPRDTTVLWTNQPCTLLASSRFTGCLSVNMNLAAAVNRWPNLSVIDWQTATVNHPEYMSSDNVHYSTVGYANWSNTVAQSLDAILAVPLDM